MWKVALISALVAVASAAYYEDTLDYWMNEINSNPSYGFRAGYNKYFAGKSLEDIKMLMGTRIGNHTFKPRKDPLKIVQASASFTAGEDSWQNCKSTIMYIKEQAHCGDCYAVSSSEVMADRTCIGNYNQMSSSDNNKNPSISFSAQDAAACCTYCGSGCGGGDSYDVFKYWNMDGVVTGGAFNSHCGCMPYEVPEGLSGLVGDPHLTCQKKCESGFPRSYTADKHKSTDYYHVQGESDMMKEIQERGPIECSFETYENFHHYKSGIYTATSGEKLGRHAIKIIGWGEEGGTPYWLINNSWGRDWGMSGQFKFIRGKNLCTMEENCHAGVAKTGESNFKLDCVR